MDGWVSYSTKSIHPSFGLIYRAFFYLMNPEICERIARLTFSYHQHFKTICFCKRQINAVLVASMP